MTLETTASVIPACFKRESGCVLIPGLPPGLAPQVSGGEHAGVDNRRTFLATL